MLGTAVPVSRGELPLPRMPRRHAGRTTRPRGPVRVRSSPSPAAAAPGPRRAPRPCRAGPARRRRAARRLGERAGVDRQLVGAQLRVRRQLVLGRLALPGLEVDDDQPAVGVALEPVDPAADAARRRPRPERRPRRRQHVKRDGSSAASQERAASISLGARSRSCGRSRPRRSRAVPARRPAAASQIARSVPVGTASPRPPRATTVPTTARRCSRGRRADAAQQPAQLAARGRTRPPTG